MNEKLFRKASIDRVNSPEQLNEYIRTANPSVWVTISAILVLLIGTIVWGVLGKIETKIDTGATVENGQATVYVSGNDIAKIADQAKIVIAEKEYVVTSVAEAPVKIDNQMDETALYYASLGMDDFCYEIKADGVDVTDGAYKVTIITESIKPISLLIK